MAPRTGKTVALKPLPLTRLEKSERRLGLLMILPAFLLLFAVVLFPIGRLLVTSTQQLRLTEPWLGTPFIGLAHYQKALADPRFWETTLNTFIYIAVTVPGAIVVGLGLALLANQPFRVKWPVRLGLLLPWALPLVFAGLIFRWFFEFNQGIVNNILMWVGLPKLAWLTDPFLATVAICIAIIWKTSSFVALILLAGLQTIPKSLYEAAEIDGASKWQQFIEITLPMLRPAIIVAAIFRTITAIQTFDIPYAMTNGGPGNSTETLAMYIHKTTIDFLDLGYGSALAVLMFVVSLAMTAGYLRYTRRDPRQEA
ncbi:sugar ABC transporter permease [Mesorhizobium sp. YIM 152430]|jgi:multiple sugar transport system permease protein|uniref:carbohydrate ABC transporter permease n=1 Tax=Mesorhizobium sp. YIM 152430 TaxID=3031761 RepID=UPI0023DA74F4|nr:sugar ABC transporter permease [Mesorhizobium sp. YIM 152430]MDF1598464.1 sugar ABC transporter permease [Mesorhizobium sp. YIM 152430]